jgi:hypothetical protein
VPGKRAAFFCIVFIFDIAKLWYSTCEPFFDNRSRIGCPRRSSCLKGYGPLRIVVRARRQQTVQDTNFLVEVLSVNLGHSSPHNNFVSQRYFAVCRHTRLHSIACLIQYLVCLPLLPWAKVTSQIFTRSDEDRNSVIHSRCQCSNSYAIDIFNISGIIQAWTNRTELV